MTYTVEYALRARQDIVRLVAFLAEKDPKAARKAVTAIRQSVAILEQFPFGCRKADENDPLLRELVIGFGQAGYVALFKIRSDSLVTILAIRHQFEDDYY